MTADNKKSKFDQVLHDALHLPLSDIERLIERLIAERDGTYAGTLPESEHGRPFTRELAANLNYNLLNNIDVEGARQIRPEGLKSDDGEREGDDT